MALRKHLILHHICPGHGLDRILEEKNVQQAQPLGPHMFSTGAKVVSKRSGTESTLPAAHQAIRSSPIFSSHEEVSAINDASSFKVVSKKVGMLSCSFI